MGFDFIYKKFSDEGMTNYNLGDIGYNFYYRNLKNRLDNQLQLHKLSSIIVFQDSELE